MAGSGQAVFWAKFGIAASLAASSQAAALQLTASAAPKPLVVVGDDSASAAPEPFVVGDDADVLAAFDDEVPSAQAEPPKDEELKVEEQSCEVLKDDANDKVALVVPPEIVLQPVCSKCKTTVDPVRAILTGKGPGCWKCPACNVKCTQLNRIFGKWPPRSFSMLPAGYQDQFYRDCKGKAGGQVLEQFVVDQLTIQRTEEEVASTGGDWLPLSVWGNKGYDVTAIEKNCTDTQDHPVLGLCYRVCIKSMHSKTIESMIRSELFHSKSKPLRDAVGTAASADESDEKDTGKNAKSTKEKRSRSSSSRSSGKGKKDKGKGKKDKGKKDKKDKGKKTSTPDPAKANIRFATRTMAKTSSLVLTLKQQLADKNVKNVPEFAVTPAKKSYDLLLGWLSTSEKCITKRGENVAMTWTGEQLEFESKQANERAALLAKMLETARKHA
jgi:hypothetical protein